MAIAARMPMIAITIINSINVKPFCIVFITATLHVVIGCGQQPLSTRDATPVPVPGPFVDGCFYYDYILIVRPFNVTTGRK
jgi:hypothetical protein